MTAPQNLATAELHAREVRWCLAQILDMLPARRDWLDPDVERLARELLQHPITPAKDGPK